MPGGWAGRRNDRSSPAERAFRDAVLARDGFRCQWVVDYRSDLRCGAYADGGADHIEPGNRHTLDNGRALCAYHHNMKSSAEGNAARWRFRRVRSPETHPGLHRRAT